MPAGLSRAANAQCAGGARWGQGLPAYSTTSMKLCRELSSGRRACRQSFTFSWKGAVVMV